MSHLTEENRKTIFSNGVEKYLIDFYQPPLNEKRWKRRKRHSMFKTKCYINLIFIFSFLIF